jgi:hypothetical protein
MNYTDSSQIMHYEMSHHQDTPISSASGRALVSPRLEPRLSPRLSPRPLANFLHARCRTEGNLPPTPNPTPITDKDMIASFRNSDSPAIPGSSFLLTESPATSVLTATKPGPEFSLSFYPQTMKHGGSSSSSWLKVEDIPVELTTLHDVTNGK